MSEIIHVTGAITSRNGITLFSADGTSMVLPQDNYRTGEVLKLILPKLAEAPGVPVTVDLSVYSIAKKLEAKLNETTALTAPLKVAETPAGELKVTTAAGEVDVTKLKDHVDRALYGEGAKGFALFMQDFAKIPHKHSAQELLHYMEHNDLPLADDGQVIVYKALNKQGAAFADTHTGKVKQRLGSRVWMPVNRVDDNRRVECSSGLHVCSHRYMFYGTDLFLAKVPAHAFIAVPQSEDGKARVSEYHLVAHIPKAQGRALGGKSAMTDPEWRKIIANVVSGEHIRVVEHVEVDGSTHVNPETPVTAVAEAKPAEKRARIAPANLEYKAEARAATRVDPKEVRAEKAKIQAGLPWQRAQVGDFVQITGSKSFATGTYKVVELDESGRNTSRVKIEYKGTKRGITNAIIQAIVAKPEADPTVAAAISGDMGAALNSTENRVNQKMRQLGERVSNLAGKAVTTVKELVGNAKREAEYLAKIENAKALLTAGKSLREVEKELRIDRKRLALRLKKQGFVIPT